MALFPSSLVSHLRFLVSSFSIRKIELLSNWTRYSLGKQKPSSWWFRYSYWMGCFACTWQLQDCIDYAGMLWGQEYFCPLYPLFGDTDEEKWYKSIVWDGRRCRGKTWMNSGFQGWRRLLVRCSFWRRKKKKAKVKQVLQRRFGFKAFGNGWMFVAGRASAEAAQEKAGQSMAFD